MIKAPVSNPARAKAIVIGAGIVALLVARFLPSELALVKSIIAVLGIDEVHVVQAPKHGGP